MSELCARVPEACVPFASATSDAEACGRSKRCSVANVGSCDALRFVDRVESVSETVRFYDGSGALVAACSSNLDVGASQCFGPVPSCARHVEQRFGAAP